MARIVNTTLTANTSNTAVWALRNTRGNRNIYTVSVAGTFGSGTITAFINSQGVAAAQSGTTYDVAIKDASGTNISYTANGAFDFECNSDPEHPTVLKIVLAGATNPSIKLTVDNVA